MVNTKEYSCTPYCTISKINKKSLLSQFRDSDFSNYANNLGKDQGNPKSSSAPFRLNSEKKYLSVILSKLRLRTAWALGSCKSQLVRSHLRSRPRIGNCHFFSESFLISGIISVSIILDDAFLSLLTNRPVSELSLAQIRNSLQGGFQIDALISVSLRLLIG